MVYLPNPTVKINGRDYTDVSVGEISISRGRDTVYAQANPASARVELIDVGALTRFSVGVPIEISMLFPAIEWELLADSWDGLANTWEGIFGDLVPGFIRPVFTGTVSDWDADAIAAQNEPVMRYQVQAVGPLATLNRRNIFFDGRVAENDGERAEAILTAALGSAVVDPTIIDDGVFGLAELDADDSGYSALQLLQEAAASAEGVIFETPDGRIGYADSARRFNQSEFLEIPFGEVQVGGLSVSSSLGDVTNVVTVEYSGGAITRRDDVSIAQFGEQDTTIQTDLVSEGAAEAFAGAFLQRHSTPSVSLGLLAFNLRNMDRDIREAVLDSNTNRGIVLTDVPRRVGFRNFEGFIEGVEIRMNRFEAELGLLVSDAVLSTGDMRWNVVPPAVTWDTVEPANLVWNDARVVG
jgi:hypothetical protein